MKTTYPPTYLWLLIGLLFVAGQTLAQHEQEHHTYKDLGWGRSKMPVQLTIDSRDELRSVASSTTKAMLDKDTLASKAIWAFAVLFPGRESVDLTNELLTNFDQTKAQTEGFELYFGIENGHFQPVIVHVDIDTNKVAILRPVDQVEQLEDLKNYHADFRQAYFWDNTTRRWNLVTDSFTVRRTPQGKSVRIYSGQLKRRIVTNKQQFQPWTKGYYLAKDVLLDAWKACGKQLLTLYFKSQKVATTSTTYIFLHLPYFRQRDLNGPVLTQPGPATSTIMTKLSILHTLGPRFDGQLHSSHRSTRPCPDYCPEDVE